jgi:hypothetical protein
VHAWRIKGKEKHTGEAALLSEAGWIPLQVKVWNNYRFAH